MAPTADALTVLTVARRSLMTAGFGPKEPPRAYCPDCRGTGRKRHVGGMCCQRCRGEGSTRVGNTKR